MAVSITCTRAFQQDGRIYIRFGKDEMEFQSRADADEFVRETLGREQLKAILVAKALKMANPLNIAGRTLTADIDAATNIVRVT